MKANKSPLCHLEALSRQGMRALLDELEQLDEELEGTSELAHQLETASKTLWEECHRIKERKARAQDTIRRIATHGLIVNEVV
jgi:hypothetical protein